VRNRHGTFTLTLPGGRTVTAPLGTSMLEAIRQAGLPHAALCGGRARCTTCRVRVGQGAEHLEPPEPLEAAALARLNAEPPVRLACQLRPRRDMVVAPLLSPAITPADNRHQRGGVNGHEQEVTVLFADLRGSTRLGEARLPYDVLFLLNQFFTEMAGALDATGGHYAQFSGDGLMALYGLRGKPDQGARAAFQGALGMLERLDALNDRLADELDAPLRMGIGIHAGEAIVGTMGPPNAPNYSAIGDNVNIAARLESQTKELGTPLVASVAALEMAGLDPDALVARGATRHEVTVKGRTAPLPVLAISDPSLLDG
ncbi:MAG: adenylate/guanylate cyclase domain-containing protein, partial [Rhodobacterales bacterium]|nr:adenylate/guanylate cyclase domain-containing protein [Rhodobacterales bacterium]